MQRPHKYMWFIGECLHMRPLISRKCRHFISEYFSRPHICSAYATTQIPHYAEFSHVRGNDSSFTPVFLHLKLKWCKLNQNAQRLRSSNLDDGIYGLTTQKRENIGYRDNPSLKQVRRVAKVGAEWSNNLYNGRKIRVNDGKGNM